MATNLLNDLLGPLRRTVVQREAANWTDGQLLERYLAERDELLFEILVERHGPMVFGLCRRQLGDTCDAEDAFQATFLVLVRKAATIRPAAQVGNWLYGVAFHTARRARTASARRQFKEKEAAMRRAGARADARPEPSTELAEQLDRELNQMPDKYRAPIVLCDLEGKTRHEAAKHLGWPEGTVAGRLARARVMLAQRLSKQGVMLPGGVVATALAEGAARANVPATLAAKTIQAATLMAAGKAVTGVISTKAAMLAEGVVKTMLVQKLKMAATALVVLTLVVFGGAGAYRAFASSAADPDPVSPRVVAAGDKEDGAKPQAADVKADEASIIYFEDNKLHVAKGGKEVLVNNVGGEARIYGRGGDNDNIVVLVHNPNTKNGAFPGPDTIKVFSARTGKLEQEFPFGSEFAMPAPKIPPQPLVVVDGGMCWFTASPLKGGKTKLVGFHFELQRTWTYSLPEEMSDTVCQPIFLGQGAGVCDYQRVASAYREASGGVDRGLSRAFVDDPDEGIKARGRWEFVRGLGLFKFKWDTNKLVRTTDKDLKALPKWEEYPLETRMATGRMEYIYAQDDKPIAVAGVSTDAATRLEAIDARNGKSMWKKEFDFRVSSIAPGANGTVLMVAPSEQAIQQYDPATGRLSKVAKINADGKWTDSVGLVGASSPATDAKPRAQEDKGKELRAKVHVKWKGRGMAFDAGLNTQMEGLALAVLGSCTVPGGDQEKKGWDAALEGDHVLITYSKPRLVGAGIDDKIYKHPREFQAVEILLPMSSNKLPDHVWVHDENFHQNYAKYDPKSAIHLQELLNGLMDRLDSGKK